jgi:predicted Zn-dependent protease
VRVEARINAVAVTSLALALGGCVTPTTQIGSVNNLDVAAEVVKQQQLFIQSSFEQQSRLNAVAGPLLRAAVPLCNAVTTRMGVYAMNRAAFTPEYREAARTLGFGDTLEVIDVQPGSPAQQAGLSPHDRILAISGIALPVGEGATEAFRDRLDRLAPRISMTVIRDSIVRSVAIARDTVCDYDVTVARKDVVNAAADGKTVYVNSGLLRFISDDDELAAVVGHEIAHNAMHHMDAKKTNALVGALVGMIFDVAAAKHGVSTDMSNQMAAAGAMVFSADFEREADYVGVYIMAAAGRNPAAAANVWRRIAQIEPGSITLASSHPTSAERFVRLDQWQNEINQRLSAGLPLRLAMKNGSVSAPLNVAQRSTVAQANRAGGSKGVADGKLASAATKQATPKAQTAALAPSQSRDATPSRVAAAATASPRNLPRSNDRMAVAIVGAPSSDSARIAAIGTFNVAKVYFDRHDWGTAEDWFKKTLLLDGSMAEYHAALGSVEMILQKWEEAEAEYTAASLIDVVNQDYRAQILEARRRKGR